MRQYLDTGRGGSNLPGATAATASGIAYSTRALDEASSGLMADPEAQLIRDCASTAVQVEEWQQWATLNKLPIEGE